MTYLRDLSIKAADSPSIDGFDRWRVSNPTTIFDSKQIHDSSLFWDDQQTSGSGTSSTYNKPRASTDIAVSTSAGTRVRQTFQRFNYQPGKALRHGEPVLTPNGWVNIEDIETGDTVFDGLGKTTTVIGKYYQGKRKIYRVTFDDGTHVDADGEHLWKTIIRQNSKKGQIRVLTTNEMIEEYGSHPPNFARWRVPASPVLEMPYKETKVDPYTMGAILGDANIQSCGDVGFTTADQEILEYLECKDITKRSSKYAYGLTGLSQQMKEYGLNGKTSHNKFIPDSFKYNSKDVRLSILQGLMDTDGGVDKKSGCAEFNSASEVLANDLAYLVRSLGGQAKITIKKCHYKKDGIKINCADSYRVRVIMPICPFKLSRKAELWKPRKRISFDRYIHSIIEVGYDEATCIRVESDDHTFLTRNHIVTHNSQEIMMTFILRKTGIGTGITRRIGPFDDNNGIFLEDIEGTINLVIRSNATGTPVETKVPQSSWNQDTMDGNGNSGINLDWTKTQIMEIDYEWLGVGRVRVAFVVDGIITYAHNFNHANNLDVVYMSTPNLPLRYEISNDGNGEASSLEHICCTVISEGGLQDLGTLFTHNTGTTHIDAQSVGTAYVILGIRLKSTDLDGVVKFSGGSLMALTNDDMLWSIHQNPTLASPVSFSGLTNSSCEVAVGNAGNPSSSSITDPGQVLASGYMEGNGQVDISVPSATLIGSFIDGTPEEYYLCATPLGANLDILGAINWREIG